jgi:hypothetical protein
VLEIGADLLLENRPGHGRIEGPGHADRMRVIDALDDLLRAQSLLQRQFAGLKGLSEEGCAGAKHRRDENRDAAIACRLHETHRGGENELKRTYPHPLGRSRRFYGSPAGEESGL